MNVVLIGILAYVAFQLTVGIIVSKRMTTESDYLLAGRGLGYWLGTSSTFATWFGAETCVGLAGAAYAGGIAGCTADPFANALSLFLMGAIFAAPLRKKNLTTLGDLFRERYSRPVEQLFVLLMVPCSLFWAAAQMRAFGQVLSATSTLSPFTATTIAATVVTLYTVSGGLLSDAITDLVQGFAIVLGLGMMSIVLTRANGGLSATATSITHIPWADLFTHGSPAIVAETWISPICGALVAQELISRVVAIRTPKMAQQCCHAAGGLYLSVGLIPLISGMIGSQLIPGLTEPEHILPRLAQTYLPVALYIAFNGAIVSAILSTVDSTLLACSALATHNVLFPLFPSLTEKKKIFYARAGVALSAFAAYVMAVHVSSVSHLIEQSSVFGSSGALIALVFGLFTKFGGARSAFASLVIGMLTWASSKYYFHAATPYLYSLAAALSIYVLIALTEKRSQKSR